MSPILNKRIIAWQILLTTILKCSGDRKYIVPNSTSYLKTASASYPNPMQWKGLSSSRRSGVQPSKVDGKHQFSSRYSSETTDQSGNLTSVILPQDSTSLIDHYQPIDNNKYWQHGAASSMETPSVIPGLSMSPPIVDNYNYDSGPDGTFKVPNGFYQEFYSGNVPMPYRRDEFAPVYNYDYQTDMAEVEDQLFAKTVLATKLLKIGKFVFVFFMVIIVFIIAGISKTGVLLSPVVLPLALIPLGVIALLLFLPLFLLFLPVVAKEMEGRGRERERRMRNATFENLIELLVEIEDGLVAVKDAFSVENEQ